MHDMPPDAAKALLDFIRSIEAPQGWGTIYGNNQGKLPKPLTTMTLNEVIKAQPTWTRRFGSSAAGGLQFMRKTLLDLKRTMPLSGSEIFDARLQYAMGWQLLKRRGYLLFVAGSITRTEFGKRLAQEWASFPVLAPTKGQHRDVQRGQSFYAGDGLNKALVSPRAVEKVLDQLKRTAAAPADFPTDDKAADDDKAGDDGDARRDDPPPPPAPKPEKKLRWSARFWTWLTTGGSSVAIAVFNLDPIVQLALLLVIVGFAVYAIATMPQVRRMLGLGAP